MPSQKNVHQMAELIKELNDSTSAILTEYAGLTVKEQTELRTEALKTKASYLVAKNKLFKMALGNKYPELVDTLSPLLQGPSGILFIHDDVAASAKVIAKFAEDHEKLKIKGGMMDGKAITVAEIGILSKLPSRNELLSKLLAQLQAPAQALVRQLNAPIQNLVYGLSALKEKLSA